MIFCFIFFCGLLNFLHMMVAFCFVNGTDFLSPEVVIHLWLAIGANPLSTYTVNKVELRASNKLMWDEDSDYSQRKINCMLV